MVCNTFRTKLTNASMVFSTCARTTTRTLRHLLLKVLKKSEIMKINYVIPVLGAKQVIPLDTNGLSDPFVIVELVPKFRYPNQQSFKTKVVSKTLNPVFDESFEL